MYVIQSKWWTSRQESVRMYWGGDHWVTDVAHARVFKNLDSAKVHLDSLVDPEHDDSGLPVKKGRKKQDWSTRGGPDHLMRTNVEIAELI